MRAYLSRYPRPFWVLLVFLFLNRVGSALIWPFMTLLMRQRLNAPLITITSLISLQAVTGLVGMVAAGNSGDSRFIPVLRDRLGDDDPLVRGHAAWALWRLLGAESRPLLTTLLAREPDADTAAEVRGLIEMI